MESMKYIYAKFYLALSSFIFCNICNLNISAQNQKTNDQLIEVKTKAARK